MARPARHRPLSAGDVARSAMEQLADLTAREPEGVTGLERNDDGWQVDVEVVESRRVPASTDVLATYEVLLDDRGRLTGYQRAGRYTRGRTDDR
jgi:hypothetical protein